MEPKLIIDWDRIANDADNTPRAVLQRYLEDCDRFDCLVVIANYQDDDRNDHWSYESSGSALKNSSIIAAAHRAIEHHIDNGEAEP